MIAVSAAALLIPVRASADDRYYRGDRDRGYYNGYYGDRHAEHEYREHRRHEEREWREHERREHEWREHEGSEHRDRYRGGYYDQFGYRRPYGY
ncbi:MAG TPA: hypothetical protein VKR61_04075 [Bryobacteraceae bacterium]|nr:hypothetical protein [Bryobacteraceae bacterium]